MGGTVEAVNTALAQEPERINREPYDGGWLCRLSPWDSAAVKDLMTFDQYEKMLAGG